MKIKNDIISMLISTLAEALAHATWDDKQKRDHAEKVYQLAIYFQRKANKK